MQVRDVMSTTLASVAPETPVGEIARLMLTRGISAVPVLGPGNEPLGVVSEADLVRREEIGTAPRQAWWVQLVADPSRQVADFVRSHGLAAADVMTPQPVCVHPDSSLREAADLMAERRVRRVYVVEAGRLVGVVSRADLLRALAAQIAGPAAGSSGDADLLREIRARIAAEPWARAAWVTIAVRDSTVELSGAVEGEAQRRALELLVRGVPGVRGVVDHLRRREGNGVSLYG